ncbi:MAG: 16S rRNA (guanine(966)-N(2))-methyltransferase RsmD [Clostridiales bacterium GWF2_36_10]|nr:MAG: 16S rRNA (guanine(966)-N(2))-methyltransferase RsmD [Clostridiales bacterium GWF2_36_10]HAN20268.1 16S rRNA (guanine(966)-N(2))-methyltransferase RsmD [Clostridiales bacterium]
MRIITGTAKGTKLVTLSGDDTRPTSEIVKEAVFSAIQFDLHDRSILDLFGGSGQLSLEALSRGAKNAVIVDANRSATDIIKSNATKTKLMEKCRIATADWKEYLKGVKGKEAFGLVFLDPPYKAGFIDEVLKRLYTSEILAKDAIIVCESEEDGVPEPIDGKEQKLYKYGRTYISIIRLA